MRTKLLLTVLAFSIAICKAQIVNIPDVNFKAYLIDPLHELDTNGDGEIQQTEASAAQYLFIDNLGIQSVTGIEAFNNLVFLDCSYNQLSSINVSGMPNLEGFYCKYNQLSDLNVASNLHLYELNCSHNQITSISLPDIVLGDLNFAYNQVANIVLPSVEEILNVSGNPLATLDLSPIDDEYLFLSHGPGAQVSIINTSLQSLLVPALRYRSIFISENSQLENISFRNSTPDFCFGDPLNDCSEFYISIQDNPLLAQICVDDDLESGSEALYMQQHTSPIENVSITTDCALSVETSNRQDFVITPNPALGFITIRSERNPDSYRIYDISGQIISSNVILNKSIDVSNLASGIYFVEIVSGTNHSIQKLVKN